MPSRKRHQGIHRVLDEHLAPTTWCGYRLAEQCAGHLELGRADLTAVTNFILGLAKEKRVGQQKITLTTDVDVY